MAELFLKRAMGSSTDAGTSDLLRPDVSGDVREISEESVWSVRGVQAPGAFDYSRRTPVLDQMGISDELIVPSFVLVAINVMDAHPSVRAAIVGGCD
jgi:hypothetical protein